MNFLISTLSSEEPLVVTLKAWEHNVATEHSHRLSLHQGIGIHKAIQDERSRLFFFFFLTCDSLKQMMSCSSEPHQKQEQKVCLHEV